MLQLHLVTVFLYLCIIVTVSEGNLTSRPPPSSQCAESDQINMFLFGLFSGFGTSLLTVLLTGLICFLKKRKRRQHDERSKTSFLRSKSIYENSLVATELDLQSAGASLDDNRCTKELPTVEDKAKVVATVEGSVVNERPTSSSLNDVKVPADEDEVDIYIGLNLHPAEHVYKDLADIAQIPQ